MILAGNTSIYGLRKAQMDQHLVPKENIQIYCCIYNIETALRELIIKSLKAIEGPRWYKKRLPGDVLKKYREGREYERNMKWTQLVLHHPIYYIDFTDLKKIIGRQDNWRDTFEGIFVRKDILNSTLSELEFVRNRIAHNRKVACEDVEIARGAYTKLSEAIGERKFNKLIAKCTYAMDISERLTELQKESEAIFLICKDCKPLEKLRVWKSVCGEWWFDETYLGHKLDEIVNYFEIIEEYASLPRTRGSGHRIELWIESSDIETKYTNAQIQFSVLLNIGGKNYGFK